MVFLYKFPIGVMEIQSVTVNLLAYSLVNMYFIFLVNLTVFLTD
jgi:hypothetical protein